MKIFNLFLNERKRNNLPKKYKNIWYNQSVWMDEKYPIIFDENKNYIDCKIGLKVIMGYTQCGKKIWYEVTDINYSKGGDFRYRSDAINCNLKFSHIEK